MVRDFRIGDEGRLHCVFHSAVREIACRDYSPEQVAAWAPEEWDVEAWSARVRGMKPFVVEVEGEIVGYGDVQDDGYMDHFFVAAAWTRRGIGAMLMRRIHLRASELGLGRLWSDVSRTAQPFFFHFGFRIVQETEAIIRGVALPNARMEKRLES